MTSQLKSLILKYLHINTKFNLLPYKWLDDSFYLAYLKHNYNIDQPRPGLTIIQTVKLANSFVNSLYTKRLYITVKSLRYIILHTNSSNVNFIIDNDGTINFVSIVRYSVTDSDIPNEFKLELPDLTAINNLVDPFVQLETMYKLLSTLIKIPTEYVTARGIRVINFDIDRHKYYSHSIAGLVQTVNDTNLLYWILNTLDAVARDLVLTLN